MTERNELTDWAAAWQADDPLPERTRQDVQHRVARSQRWWRIGTLAEAVIAVVGLAVVLSVGLRAERPVERVAMTSLAVVVLLTVAGGWWLRRDTWRPAAESTAAWIEFLIRRATRRVQMAWFGAAILPVEIAIFVPWILSRAERAADGRDAALLLGFTLLAGLCALLGAGLFLLGRHARRELDQLKHLQRELQ